MRHPLPPGPRRPPVVVAELLAVFLIVAVGLLSVATHSTTADTAATASATAVPGVALAAGSSAVDTGRHAPASTRTISTAANADLHIPLGNGYTATVRSIAVRSGGRGRTYLLLNPTASATGTTATATGPVANTLVVLLHGSNVTAAQEMQRTGFGALAVRDHFILAAPQSVGPSWNSEDGCCDKAAREHINDIAFVRAVVANVRTQVDIDPRRIFLVGYSNGGKLSYGVACSMPGVFAAQATYGSGPQRTCRDTSAQSAFIGYGADDPKEPPAGMPHNSRGRHQPADTTVAQFVARDGCTTTPTVHVVGPATVHAYRDCRDGSTVTFVLWANQTHTFPAAPALPTGAAAVTLMWAFFSAHGATTAT